MKQGLIGNFFKRILDVGSSDESGGGKRPHPQPQPQPQLHHIPPSFDINNIPSDLTDRPRITSYHPNQRDEIRRAYWIKGPSQPKVHDFPSIKIGGKNRRFVKEWFDEFNWLEYSIKENKAYCLCCCLFGDIVGQQGGRDVFVTGGFDTWSKKKSLKDHEENAPKNEKLTSPKIQKEIVQCFSKKIIKSICEEIGNDVFTILADESSDVSKKEQMAMVFNNLSISQVRGQGYDGASNTWDAFNGLKALILKDNHLAYYIHCFAHQLQLVVVTVAKNHDGDDDFFEQLALVVNVVCASCKRKYIIRDSYKERVQKEIGNGEIETGRGLNQETSLVQARDTKWGSHYKTIISLKNLFPEVIKIFGLTNTLSKHLQRNDQNILEAASLVKVTMKTFKAFRNNGFPSMLEKKRRVSHHLSVDIKFVGNGSRIKKLQYFEDIDNNGP
ncbi:uncharacterized protein LOC111903409 [Lactuca sativa]|uniref:uncharacterized protein LOC111903409 n=1 Tax=Lactuca sativa TaxID=4236 RepID=UPI000CD84C69|nr:uncharacterized protein LOC111903409 [Lactuca sativa]